jgi:hypothetical protein
MASAKTHIRMLDPYVLSPTARVYKGAGNSVTP